MRPQVSTPEGHLNERRLSPQGNTGAVLDSLNYLDAAQNIYAPESQISSWNSSRMGGGSNQESGKERDTELNRSKELSSRMRYKYY